MSKKTREIIKVGPEDNYTAPTKSQLEKHLRAHLIMMLEAMQYEGPVQHLTNDTLRDLVEEQKIIFLRKLQVAHADN